MALRDQSARGQYNTEADPGDGRDEIEIPRTLARLGEVKGRTVLELGCGNGRYTRRLAARGARVLAVDFSRDSLALNARRLLPNTDGEVGLIHGDVSAFKVAPHQFDLALSTFYSNLPSRELRLASSHIVHNALRPDGKYVLSAHHYHLRDSLRKAPRTGTYAGGIFYQSFDRTEFERELREVFGDVRHVPIDIWVPYISRARSLRPRVSQVAEFIPAVNLLGLLILATARPGR
jgi:SAM-dependent methyltransferase